jgi:cytoskeletal protein RodZ
MSTQCSKCVVGKELTVTIPDTGAPTLSCVTNQVQGLVCPFD